MENRKVHGLDSERKGGWPVAEEGDENEEEGMRMRMRMRTRASKLKVTSEISK